MSKVRGIRGAINVEENTPEKIIAATTELLIAIVDENNLKIDDIASILFTVTPDLNADFPATAARNLGWTYVPLLCATEIDVSGAMQRCIRVLMHVNTDKAQEEIKHVFLHEAAKLRIDLQPH